MASKIGKKEWIALYVITGLIDVFQILIDLFLTEFFAIPEAVNEVINIVVGAGMLIYFPLRGVSLLKHPSRIASILGMEVLTDITGGAASFWVLDIWYIHKNVKQEEAEEKAKKELAIRMAIDRQALNQNGVRLPETQTATSYAPTNESGTSTGTNQSKRHIGTYNYDARPLNIDGVRGVNKQQSRSTRKIDTNETLAA